MNSSVDIVIGFPHWKKVLPDPKKYIALVTNTTVGAINASRKNNFSLTILLTSDAHMIELNCDFRGKNTPTNVLSFPSGEKEYLGDIALGFETLKREAKEQGKKFEHHVAHMLVHGVLHLLGYDHQIKKEEKEMEVLEIQILKTLGIANPYVV